MKIERLDLNGSGEQGQKTPESKPPYFLTLHQNNRRGSSMKLEKLA